MRKTKKISIENFDLKWKKNGEGRGWNLNNKDEKVKKKSKKKKM